MSSGIFLPPKRRSTTIRMRMISVVPIIPRKIEVVVIVIGLLDEDRKLNLSRQRQ
jgi:hypothetical protein